MRVVLDARIAQEPREGLGVYVANLIEAIADLHEGHQLVLITTSDAPPLALRPMPGVEVVPAAPSLKARLGREIWEQLRLDGLLKELKADVYHGPAYTIPCLRSGACPAVVTFYDASVFALPECYSAMVRVRFQVLMRWAARSAAGVICGSKHALAECTRYLGASLRTKARVIYIALPRDIETYGEPSPSEVQAAKRLYSDGCDYLFAVGTIHPRKNYERLVDAFARLGKPDLKLLICGKPSWKSGEAADLVRRLGLQDRVRFLGNLPTGTMRSLMKGARVFVFPSLYEGFGIPPLEAFALGTPVAASSASSIPEVTGDAALLFDPLSTEDIGSAIRRLIDEPGLSTEFVRRGRERLSGFSWERCAREHVEVYRAAILRWRQSR